HRRIAAAPLAAGHHAVRARAGARQGAVREQLPHRRPSARAPAVPRARARRRHGGGAARGHRACGVHAARAQRRRRRHMTAQMIGKVYGIPPQPPIDENTRVFPAGAVSFSVEYRDLDPEMLEETYKDNPAYLAELREKSPEGGFADEGVTVHVFDTVD